MAKDTLNLEVKSNIKSVTKDSDDLGRSIGKAVDETKGLGGTLKDAGEKGAGGFKKMGTAVKGMGMALKAAGIGLIVALVAKLMEVFSKNQKVVDAFDTAMTALSIAFNDLFSFLSESVGKITGWFKEIFENPMEKIKDFGQAIKENMQERVNSAIELWGLLGKVIKQVFEKDFSGAMKTAGEAYGEYVDIFTGVDDTLGKVKKGITNAAGAINEYATEVYNSAEAITELNKAAEMAAVVNQGIIADKVREAELLRQTRDSEKETFAARIKANQDLKVTLEAQKKAMLENANIMKAAAQAQKDINGSQENKIALQQAINEKKAIEEQITGFMSEQLTNQESLERELAEVKKELAQDSIEGMERELLELKNSYESKLDMARKADVDSLALTEKYEKERHEIVVAAIEAAADAKQAIDDKVIADQKAIDDKALAALKATEDAKAAIRDVNIANIEGGLSLVKSMAGENEGIMKAALVAENAVGIAKNIINTNAANARLTLEGGVAAPALITANFVRMGIGIAASIAATAQGLSALGGGSPGPAPDAGVDTVTPAPQMMSGAFELTGGQEVEPARAYVVSDDITDSQNGLAIIRRRATI